MALHELHALQRVVLGATLLASLLFLVLAWWGAGVISRPLEALTRLARRIEELRRSLIDGARSYGFELVMPPLLIR